MSYKGVVKNGVVVLPSDAKLEEGAEVHVVPVVQSSFAERMKEYIGAFKDLPEDYALNWRHYRYGERKREQ